MKGIRDFTQKRYFKVFREDRSSKVSYKVDDKCSFQKKIARHFGEMCNIEVPVVFPEEKITFTRTNTNITPAYTYDDLIKEFDINHKYYNVINNVCPDYGILLKKGLNGIKEELKKTAKDIDFIESCEDTIASIEKLVMRYIEEAKRVKNDTVVKTLSRVPMEPARSFLEGLQAIRFISSMFYLNGNYQLGFGRIDQYLIDLYHKDIGDNTISVKQAKEYITEFFISLNRDTDLYFGVQQGDNGQSMMLGGVKRDGSCAINELTYLFLEVSKELKMIDPKINLRIDSNTPRELLLLGCELTKAGLGFPQYSNDEVVIPALVNKGYSLEDARDYTVAACWEFIIPGKGLDIVNQGAVSFPYAVNEAFMDPKIKNLKDFEDRIAKNIQEQVKNILVNREQYLLPSPLVSLFFDDSIKMGEDITKVAKYKNRGIHGAGSANAADAMYIVENLIELGQFEKIQELRNKVNTNFAGSEDYRQLLLGSDKKVGNANEKVDLGLRKLFEWFADACDKYSTDMCKIRPGSGSAQFYIWLTNKMNDWIIEPIVGATADGRLEGEPLSSSLSPASGVKVNGLISVLNSFSNINYNRIMNGGPITVEFSPVTFNSREGLEKLADVIKYFVKIGDQQLQLNVLDYRVLCDAMKHPERHSNLIVRVWGWSGYFCELAPEFQRQIINRHRYSL